ncbi:hypothetical protein J6590_068128 [Homalodisca vitripennis]|nr:hypothetical protein J6590_068128 [Homalodisca vitripennis]
MWCQRKSRHRFSCQYPTFIRASMMCDCFSHTRDLYSRILCSDNAWTRPQAAFGWLTLTSLPTSCSPAPALALATVRSGQTRSEKLTVFWLFSVLPVSPWLANSPTFGRVPVSAVSGTGAASLPEQLKN